MSSQPLASRPFSSPGARPTTDRRRHRRISIPLLGRFMRANHNEYPCRLTDISVGGAAVMSPVAVHPGERIIAYIDLLGGLEGTVARVFDGGFAIKFQFSAHKREKLAAQLTWLLNKDLVSGIDRRRHERIAVPDRTSTLHLENGISLEVALIDVSLSGASLQTEVRPAIGSEVTLGKLRGRVMRHHEKGIGVEFLDIQEPEALRRHFM